MHGQGIHSKWENLCPPRKHYDFPFNVIFVPKVKWEINQNTNTVAINVLLDWGTQNQHSSFALLLFFLIDAELWKLGRY